MYYSCDMKKIIYISAILVLAFSCKKNDYFIEKVDQNEGDDIVFVPYLFQGTLKDTTNGNSLVGYKIYTNFGYPNFYQSVYTIMDSTYFVQFGGFGILDSTYNETHNKIQVRDLSGIIVDSFAIPVSYWIANDTATYDYSF